MDLTNELIKKAKEGKSHKFELITNWAEFRAALYLKKSLKKIAKAFKAQAVDDLKNYTKLVKDNVDDVSLLVRHRDMKICHEFYENEYITTSNMCFEYEVYLTVKLRWLEAFMGLWDRPEEDMRDFTEKF